MPCSRHGHQTCPTNPLDGGRRSVWPQFYDKVGGKAVVDEALAIMQQ